MLDIFRLRRLLIQAIWEPDLESLPTGRAVVLRGLRLCYVAIRDVAEGQLTLRAMSLVYTTLLSLVPLLAVSFSVLKAFGVHNQIEPLLLHLLAPLGDKGLEITERILQFVENVRVGVLGSLGLAFLIYTVISLVQKIERAFNYTWHVDQHRPFAQRFSDYLTVIIIGPVLVFTAMGITASVMSASMVQQLVAYQPLGSAVRLAGRLVPYVLIIGAFTFIYVFVPNTRVRLRSALLGGAVAGVLWETTGWVFTSFVVTSTKYTAIYSAFATLIMFMIWLYLSWIILLVGASIAFYHQHPEYLTVRRRELRLSTRMHEKLALLAMCFIARHYYYGRPAWTLEALSQRLHTPIDLFKRVMNDLRRGGLLLTSGDDPPTYLPARPLETTPISEVLAVIRSGGEEAAFNFQRLPTEAAVDALLIQNEAALEAALRARTLRDLALGEMAAVRPVSADAAAGTDTPAPG